MRPRSPLLPIFLIVLVDILGFTIVIPLLPFYALRFGASALTATLLVSVFAACSLVSSPIIGRLSDRFGRKPLLLISQAGTCAGFLTLGFSTSLWMVFVGRILDGITAGNLSLAQAYISDHTRPQDRAKAFGVIGVAFGIGFMFGPYVGGTLGGYGYHVPFLVAAALSGLSILATQLLLPREAAPGVRAAAGPDAAPAAEADAGPPPPAGRRPGLFDVEVYAAYFRRPGLLNLYAQFFLFSFAFSCFTSGFGLFAHGRLGWGPREVGHLFAYSGLLGVILQGGLIGRLVKRFGEATLATTGFAAAALAYALLGVTDALGLLLVCATIAAYGNGVLRPVITSSLSQAVGRHEQGVALGISQSLGSVAMILAPAASGALIERAWLLPWALLAAGASAAGLLAALARRAGSAARGPAGS